MRRIVTTLAAAGAVLAATLADTHTAACAPAAEPNRIDIAYGEPKIATNQAAYKLLKEHQVLEKIRDLLSPLRLPHRLLIQTQD